ncbi:hypothetical protein JXA63_03895 [Candidatus Woesebacteria bacterium]|nr:hypothetical protein [Candidatus Woesebacteria bacterium]
MGEDDFEIGEHTVNEKELARWMRRKSNLEQKKRFNGMTPEEKAAWGFTEDTLDKQRKKDEEKNPSKP